MTASFDFKAAKAAGYSDSEINDYLGEQHNFDIGEAKKSGYSDKEISDYLSNYRPSPKQEPVSLKGAAISYLSGVAGGAGGLVPDLLKMVEPVEKYAEPFFPALRSASKLAKLSGAKTTSELTESLSRKMGGQEPQNALERILQQSGEFGGQAALIETALGGPLAGGEGLVHGSVSGAFYGALKELGMPDGWALGTTALLTVSPIAARKFIDRIARKGATLLPKQKPPRKTTGQPNIPPEEPPPGGGGGAGQPNIPPEEPPPGGGGGAGQPNIPPEEPPPGGGGGAGQPNIPPEEPPPGGGGGAGQPNIPPEEPPPGGGGGEGTSDVQFPDYPFESDYELGRAVQDLIPEIKNAPSLRARAQTIESPEKAVSNLLSPEKRKLYNVASRANQIKLEPISVRGTEVSRATPRQIVGNEISPERFHSAVQGGRGLENEINQVAALRYEDVNNLYEVSKEMNKTVYDYHPELSMQMEEIIADIDSIPEPSSIQKDIRNTARQISKRIGTAETGYLEISNEDLIKQIQSINQKRSFEYAEAVPENAFGRLTDPLYQAIEKANPEAAAANAAARNAYRQFAEVFDNPKIKPFRSRIKHDYPALYRDAQNFQTYSMLSEILAPYERGQQFLRALERDMVDNRLEQFFNHPNRINGEEYQAVMRELSDTIGPEMASRINETMQQFIPTERFRPILGSIARKEFETLRPTEIEELVKGKDPEQISSMINNLSGLKKIEKAVDKLPGGKQTVEKIKNFKTLDLIYNGKLTPKESPKDLLTILNDREKVAFLNETMGRDNVQLLKNVAEKGSEVGNFLEQYAQAHPDFKNIENMTSLVFQILKGVKAGISIFRGKIPIQQISYLLNKKNLNALGRLAKGMPKGQTKFSKEQLEFLANRYKNELNDLLSSSQIPE